jgi:hypothetical protein
MPPRGSRTDGPADLAAPVPVARTPARDHARLQPPEVIMHRCSAPEVIMHGGSV